MVRETFPTFRLIVNDDNRGFARANNQSWEIARGRYWLLLNSDAELCSNALRQLLTFMEAHTKTALATARLVNADGSPQHCAQATPSLSRVLLEASRLHKLLPSSTRGEFLFGPYWTYDKSIRVGWTWGTALMARREAVEEVGPLSEDYFMYGEDLEWCLRMERAGWEVWYCAEAEVLHHGGESSKQRWASNDRQRIIEANVLKAVETHRGAPYARLLNAGNRLASRIEDFRRARLGEERA
jgi:GT2 family glycosyltransferase